MIKAILAADDYWGIGRGGTLPWPKNTEDLRQFRAKTSGCIVVMGSSTWHDHMFPKPLPNRENIVISRNTITVPGVVTLSGYYNNALIELSKSQNKDIWIIGGASIFEQSLSIFVEVHVTRIKGSFSCDVFFHLDSSFEMMTSEIPVSDSDTNSYFTYRVNK